MAFEPRTSNPRRRRGKALGDRARARHHQEWIDRLQAVGGNLSLTGWQYLAGNPTASTVAPYAGPPFRMIVDSSKRPDGIQPE